MKNFYSKKRVLVTGHTGFKGSWLCRMLHVMGSEVFGYALEPPTDPSLFKILDVDNYVTSKISDITDFDSLSNFYEQVKPDIVFHLAAQPLVKEGYNNPKGTYHTNVMGTVNILECVRLYGAKSFLNVTTDKVYDNIEDLNHLYSENERLDGFDPYSNSKSCSELVTHSYTRSFPNLCPLSTARAGNVIGGGDFAADRIVPDCVRAAIASKEVILRNPNSVRPYQHVLEPLYSYLMIAMEQFNDPKFSGNYNIGPENKDCITTGQIADLFCRYWGDGLRWKSIDANGPHEANYLKLDNTKMKSVFGIAPMWDVSTAVDKTVEWTKAWIDGKDIIGFTDTQIREYLEGRNVCV